MNMCERYIPTSVWERNNHHVERFLRVASHNKNVEVLERMVRAYT